MSQAKTFGRYSLVRKVAQGGMAEIFLAKFQGIGGFEKKIIIKRILPSFSENQEFIRMLIHEAKTAVQLHHQNIVQIYDLGKVKDTYFISMEYIRGKDLRTALNRLKSQGQKLPPELAVFIAREVCKGLDYAHNITDQHGQPLNLVHRDISPPNILLSLEGEVKIIDFGIAKATSQATDTQAGVFKGKFAYMSPEQAQGIPVDRRSDIFATGLILWEMLTLKKLLEAESDILTLERAKKIDAYEPGYSPHEIPEQLETIIRRAIKQDREGRYQSAGEMARDLTIYLNLNYPGFSETDLADFLRSLFNLDRRRGAGGDLVSHGQGERSLTGSDFFKPLLNPGHEPTDPSAKIGEAAAKAVAAAKGSSTAEKESEGEKGASGAATGHSNGAAAVAGSGPDSSGEKRVAKAVARRARGGEYWSLEDDIREDIDVFAKPGEKNEKGGWVSQVADDFARAEDGTLHPLITGALRAEVRDDSDPGSDLAGDVPISSDTPSSGNSAVPGQSLTGASAAAGAQSERRRSSLGVWFLTAIVLVFGVTIVGSFLFPAQVQELRERLGLIRTADVVVNYSPAAAEVELNGEKVANASSPLRLALPVGQRHQLIVKAEGFEEKQIPIDLVTNTAVAPISVELSEVLPTGDGQLVLEGLLSGAVVYINDWPTVEDQWTSLPTGRPLTVRVVKDHYLPFETQVTLGEEPETLEVVLRPEPVTLKVESTPTGADVLVDGLKVGKTPYEGEGFEPGQVYKIEVRADGYKPYSSIVTPTVGATYPLNVALASSEVGRASRPIAATRAARKPPPKPTPEPQPEPKPTPPAASSQVADASGNAATSAETVPETVAQPVQMKPRPRGTVQVQIFVNPWAEVYIDGSYVGRTPVTVKLKSGRHTIRLVNQELSVDFVDTKDIEPPQFGETQSFWYEMG